MNRDEFFHTQLRQGLGLSYDDVQIETDYSDVMPDEVHVSSRFSRNVSVCVPIVSAAMDRVTETRMAIGVAMLGGLGIIHRNMNPDTQIAMVGKVKYATNGLIDRPKCVGPNDTIGDILDRKNRSGFQFHSFPVTSGKGKLLGLLTQGRFDFCENPKARALDIMETNLITAPVGTSLDDAYRIMVKKRVKVLPIVTKTGTLKGLYIFTDVKRIKNGTEYNLDSRGKLIVGAAVGVGESAIRHSERLIKEGVDVLVIDTAHADTRSVMQTLTELKKHFSSTDVVAGNISRPESAKRLLDAGADGIKVGQGPGSICTTRVVAGVGCTQLTAVYRIRKIAEIYNVPVCADGGIRYPGDVTKAVAAGAESVMLGSVLAGTDEAPGEDIFYENRRWKSYRGMGSEAALKESEGSRERYRQEGNSRKSLRPEGVEGMVPYKGDLRSVIEQYVGGLKLGMGYVGARTLRELEEKATFIRVTSAGVSEAHPHTVLTTKESPNYGGR